MPRPLTLAQRLLLNKVYYQEGKMLGRDRLWSYMKENHAEAKLSQRQVGEFVANQEVAQINQRAKSERDVKTALYTTRGNLGIDLKDNQNLAGNTKGKYQYIFVAVDLFTRYVYAVPMKKKETKYAVRAMKKVYKMVKKRGKTKMSIRSDQGSEFINKDFKAYLKRKNITQVLSAAGTPHSNGMVEKANDIIGRLISKLTLADPSFDWAKSMNKITDAINNTPNKTTGYTPVEVEGFIKDDDKEALEELIQNQAATKGRARAVATQEFEVGDKARLYVFQEGQKYKQRNWSKETYDVVKVNKPKTPYGIYTYKLDGLNNVYKGNEILKVKSVENEVKDDREDMYEVSKIVRLTVRDNQPAYEIRWKGLRPSENTIEFKKDIIKDFPKARLMEKKTGTQFVRSSNGKWRVESLE